MNRFLSTMLIAGALLLLGGCEPEVGSERWCEKLQDKPKGDWSANEIKDYAKHCLFRADEPN